MEITLENTGSCTKLLKVLVPAARVKHAFDEFYAHLAPTAKVAGFRPGKVPRAVMEKNYQQDARQEVVHHIVPEVFKEVVSDRQLKPAMPPMLTKVEWKLDDALYFEVQVDLIPEFKMPVYRGVSVQIQSTDVTDQDVQEAIDRLREQHAQLIPLTGRGLQGGDVAVVDQKVTIGDQVLEDSKDLMYEMDPKRLNSKIQEALLGAKAGDAREVDMTVPEHYPKKEWIGKPAKVALSVKDIKEKKLPEANDDFAKDLGQYESFSDLAAKVRGSLEKYQKEMERLQIESKVNELLIKNTAIELPERMIEKQKKVMHEAAQEKGQAPEKPDEAYWKVLSQRAADQLKLYFLYQRIAQQEKLAPADAEVGERINAIAARAKQNPAVVREHLTKNERMEDLMEQIVQDKVVDFLVSQAKVEKRSK